MKFRPLADWVVLEKIEQPDTTLGGIYIPQTAKKESTQGRVVAVGEGRRRTDGQITPMSVKMGDTVLFNRYGVTEFKQGNEVLFLVREEDILGVVES